MSTSLRTGISPFVKWVGGKRQLLPQIKCRLPQHYGKYYEPFVGGGALLFELMPEYAVINDSNGALINAYRVVAGSPGEFMDVLGAMDSDMWEDGESYYYSLLVRYNKKLLGREFDVELAALFVFLNKHCFNGLYRVRKDGAFNVAYNFSGCASFARYNIEAVSGYLRGVEILCGDFEAACGDAESGDFVFLDSPYVPVSPKSFEAYTKHGFSVENHRRLAGLFDSLTARGCYCMLTNHNTEFVRSLYGGKGYSMDVVGARRSVNSDASNRVGEEIIICNY